MTDSDRYVEFVRLSSPRLQRTAWALTGDWASADDLLQTALMKAWAKWDDISVAASPEAYVRRIMMTTFLKWRRRMWTRESPVGQFPAASSSVAPNVDLQTRDALITALKGLPIRQRAVIVLRYFDDLTEQATADIMGCSIGTVKSQNARALKTLRAVPELKRLTNGAVL